MRFSDAYERLDGTGPGDRLPWLAVGPRAVRALREAGVESAARVRRVRDVHRAIEVLERGRYEGCVVDAKLLTERPTAALGFLRVHLGAERVFVVTRKANPALARAARHLGIAVCVPADGGRPAAGAPRRVLPRADLPPAAPSGLSPERFAARCLEHLEDVDGLVAWTVEALREEAHAERTSLMLVDEGRRSLTIRHARGLDENLVGVLRCPLGRGIAGRAASLGRPLAGYGDAGGPRDYRGTAYVVLPLGDEQACLGVVCLTGLAAEVLPDEATLDRWREIARLAGRSLAVARRLERAESLMDRDALTGLPNRRAFERALSREIDRAGRSGGTLGVAIFDADRFKRVNDEYGHPAGDQVLVALARTLQRAFRDSDLVARWGGEEFAILLPGQPGDPPEAVLRALERARRAVRARPVSLGYGLPPHRLSVSGGVAFYPLDAREGPALVEAADQALLLAKQSGRDRVLRA